jgi:hypothetical protein
MSKFLVGTVVALGVVVEGAGSAAAGSPPSFTVRGHESVTLDEGATVHGGVGVAATGGVPYRLTLGAGAWSTTTPSSQPTQYSFTPRRRRGRSMLTC